MPLQTWAEFLPALKQARLDQGLTQKHLAEQIGVAPSAISLWENQVRTPTQANAERWAELLGAKLPGYATLWFNRKERAKEIRHGTRNGYEWHRRHGDMPACDPCRAAATEFAEEWRSSRR